MYIEGGSAAASLTAHIKAAKGNEIIYLLGPQYFHKGIIVQEIYDQLTILQSNYCIIKADNIPTHSLIIELFAKSIIASITNIEKKEIHRRCINSRADLSLIWKCWKNCKGKKIEKCKLTLISQPVSCLIDILNTLAKYEKYVLLAPYGSLTKTDIDIFSSSSLMRTCGFDTCFILAVRPNYEQLSTLRRLTLFTTTSWYIIAPRIVWSSGTDIPPNIVSIDQIEPYADAMEIGEYIALVESKHAVLAQEHSGMLRNDADGLYELMAYIMAFDSITVSAREALNSLYIKTQRRKLRTDKPDYLWEVGNYCFFNNSWNHFAFYYSNKNRLMEVVSNCILDGLNLICMNAWNLKSEDISVISEMRLILNSVKSSMITPGFSYYYFDSIYSSARLIERSLFGRKNQSSVLWLHISNLINWVYVKWSEKFASIGLRIYYETQQLDVLIDIVEYIMRWIDQIEVSHYGYCFSVMCFTMQEGVKWSDYSVIETIVKCWKSFEKHISDAVHVMLDFYDTVFSDAIECRNQACAYYPRNGQIYCIYRNRMREVIMRIASDYGVVPKQCLCDIELRNGGIQLTIENNKAPVNVGVTQNINTGAVDNLVQVGQAVNSPISVNQNAKNNSISELQELIKSVRSLIPEDISNKDRDEILDSVDTIEELKSDSSDKAKRHARIAKKNLVDMVKNLTPYVQLTVAIGKLIEFLAGIL